MEWYVFALASALFSAIAAILEKKMLFKEKAFEFTVVLSLFNASLAMLFFPLVDLSKITAVTYAVVFGKSILNGLAFLCVMYSIKNLELSEALPLLALTPGFVAVFAFSFLGEVLSIAQAAGLILLMAGVYIHGIGAKQKLLDPFRKFFTAKGHKYVLAALVLFTVTTLLDKVILTGFKMAPEAYMVFENLFFAAIIPAAFFITGGKIRGASKVIISSGKMIFILAAVTMVYRYTYILSVKFSESVALALAVKRISVFIAVILGGMLFKEHSLKRRIIATAMLVVGTLLIV
jgi:drug/metabolite transporter (DMT)-like permease